MNHRPIYLAALFAALGVAYAVFFTEWLRPAPIGIASQIRPSILQPRFGRGTGKPRMMVVKDAATNPPTPAEASPGPDVIIKKEMVATTNPIVQARRTRMPDWGQIEQAPGGVANVTFSLDTDYNLTVLRVLDVPADGSAPKVLWELEGKSSPTRSLLYGRIPQGMHPTKAGAQAEPLTPGAPYRLYVESGRRRGTNAFTTSASAVQ